MPILLSAADGWIGPFTNVKQQRILAWRPMANLEGKDYQKNVITEWSIAIASAVILNHKSGRAAERSTLRKL